ncbi:MAG: hypothetical protein WBI94_04135 [Candidatus Cloacimonadaceae bacterium]
MKKDIKTSLLGVCVKKTRIPKIDTFSLITILFSSLGMSREKDKNEPDHKNKYSILALNLFAKNRALNQPLTFAPACPTLGSPRRTFA